MNLVNRWNRDFFQSKIDCTALQNYSGNKKSPAQRELFEKKAKKKKLTSKKNYENLFIKFVNIIEW